MAQRVEGRKPAQAGILAAAATAAETGEVAEEAESDAGSLPEARTRQCSQLEPNPEPEPQPGKGQAVVLTVRNSGAGIAATDLPHIFERFYRADKARGEERGNYVLGLSIAKAALDRLGASIDVQSVPTPLQASPCRFHPL